MPVVRCFSHYSVSLGAGGGTSEDQQSAIPPTLEFGVRTLSLRCMLALEMLDG